MGCGKLVVVTVLLCAAGVAVGYALGWVLF